MNWYRLLLAQQLPLPSPDQQAGSPELQLEQQQVRPLDHSTPVEAPEPSPAAVERVVEDFLHGINVEKIAGSKALIKTAGVTGHYRHKLFYDAFAKLTPQMKDFARKNFKKMIANPQQVALKPLPGSKANSGKGKADIWSAQVGYGHRALAVRVGNAYVWYWIGSHESYNRQKDAPAPAVFNPSIPKPKTPVNQ